METKIFYVFIITLTECYLVYSNISTGYPISGEYPMGTGMGRVSHPINLVGIDICKSLGYNFGLGIIIPKQNPIRCQPYSALRSCDPAAVPVLQFNLYELPHYEI
jgi:hypothetical protein